MSVQIPIQAWICQTKEEIDMLLLHGGKIIVITEEPPEYLVSPQYGNSQIMANDLLPGYDAVSAYLEGDYAGFTNQYTQMLLSPECEIYFVTILSAIVNGIPLGFVFGDGEIEQAALPILINVFRQFYGIYLAHNFDWKFEPALPAGFMYKEFVASNVRLLFMHNLITCTEFLFTYPTDQPIPNDCIDKLMVQQRPFVHPYSQENIVKYYDEIRNNIRKFGRAIGEDPMTIC